MPHSTINTSKSLPHLRFVTATALFDGHDALINIVRRILQNKGVEVIHLGHNRSVDEIVRAAEQEDAHAVVVSSYQGGHLEFFKYMFDLLKKKGLDDVKIFGGGGGVIIPSEKLELEKYGITRIYGPSDKGMGFVDMVEEMISLTNYPLLLSQNLEKLTNTIVFPLNSAYISRLITTIENQDFSPVTEIKHQKLVRNSIEPLVIGITGTGGAGKSSLTDELIRCFRIDQNDDMHIALLSIDPTRRKTRGALLGDRIRMNSIEPWNKGEKVYMRSLATRDNQAEICNGLNEIIGLLKKSGFNLIFVETCGIGQGDSAIIPYVDISLYVMTPEYGASSQLEKIEMLDCADIVVINKFDRKGGLDAIREVGKQLQRNREQWHSSWQQMPVFGTIASQFNDDGVFALFQHLKKQLMSLGLSLREGCLPKSENKYSIKGQSLISATRTNYLSEISQTIHEYKNKVTVTEKKARLKQQVNQVMSFLSQQSQDELAQKLWEVWQQVAKDNNSEVSELLSQWEQMLKIYTADEFNVSSRSVKETIPLTYTSLSGTKIAKIALPKFHDDGDKIRWLSLENIPGKFPYTAGTFALKRTGEDPTRMFAGEGDAYRTNSRFKLLSKDMPAKRLSTAFDSVTLYGNDPHIRPDIYGKVGNSGVSIATLDDMKVLYSGFDLCDPSTSVSMTINGPAPTILAFFLNTAIDQKIAQFVETEKREPTQIEAQGIQKFVLENVRGTVQADILKEDQGQNTCLFSTEFSLKMMGDIAEYFIANNVRNFYSVSISGYHIAEAGANPLTQLAFTLANGFTYVEYYLSRGMKIDDFAPNFSFFFSNGMDPEYTVMGRVARRIWAVAMKHKYGGNERSQKLKYHIQTSGRSLHALEIQFNDIRTTLQALIAIYDNCNSLHTNAYDEAITTPSPESVRRALAIQLIINKEWGLAKNENPNQGAFILEELTELVEEAVLTEFDKLTQRGGVLGAMETGYQRGQIQDQSLYYEELKHTGAYPIVGVNTFLSTESKDEIQNLLLMRSSEEEKSSQLTRLTDFQNKNITQAEKLLEELKFAVVNKENVFAKLMQVTRYCSLGQITNAFFQVGGQYRRNM